MNCRRCRFAVSLVLLNEVKHLAQEQEVGIALASQISFAAQILRFAQHDKPAGHFPR